MWELTRYSFQFVCFQLVPNLLVKRRWFCFMQTLEVKKTKVTSPLQYWRDWQVTFYFFSVPEGTCLMKQKAKFTGNRKCNMEWSMGLYNHLAFFLNEFWVWVVFHRSEETGWDFQKCHIHLQRITCFDEIEKTFHLMWGVGIMGVVCVSGCVWGTRCRKTN